MAEELIDLWNDPGRSDPLPDATVGEDIILLRQNICNSCESLKAYICDNCLCFMPIKVRLAETECPLNKW